MTTYCTKEEALVAVDKMTDKELRALIEKTPARVQMLVRSGMVDYRTTLAEWYTVISV